jgi:hypothetical protein
MALAVPASAQAGVLVASASSCEDRAISQPFTPWADVASYVLAPGGTLEGGTAGWTLTGRSAAALGNEIFHVSGASDSGSLALPDGSTATTGAMCVGLEHPTIRLFLRRTAGSALSGVNVEALFEDASGEVRSLSLGTVAADEAWHPTPPLVVTASLLPLLPGEHTAVAFRFSAHGADFQVDDVYVDPYMRY